MTASRRFALGTFALALSVHLALATISAGTEPSFARGADSRHSRLARGPWRTPRVADLGL